MLSFINKTGLNFLTFILVLLPVHSKVEESPFWKRLDKISREVLIHQVLPQAGKKSGFAKESSNPLVKLAQSGIDRISKAEQSPSRAFEQEDEFGIAASESVSKKPDNSGSVSRSAAAKVVLRKIKDVPAKPVEKSEAERTDSAELEAQKVEVKPVSVHVKSQERKPEVQQRKKARSLPVKSRMRSLKGSPFHFQNNNFSPRTQLSPTQIELEQLKLKVAILENQNKRAIQEVPVSKAADTLFWKTAGAVRIDTRNRPQNNRYFEFSDFHFLLSGVKHLQERPLEYQARLDLDDNGSLMLERAFLELHFAQNSIKLGVLPIPVSSLNENDEVPMRSLALLPLTHRHFWSLDFSKTGIWWSFHEGSIESSLILANGFEDPQGVLRNGTGLATMDAGAFGNSVNRPMNPMVIARIKDDKAFNERGSYALTLIKDQPGEYVLTPAGFQRVADRDLFAWNLEAQLDLTRKARTTGFYTNIVLEETLLSPVDRMNGWYLQLDYQFDEQGPWGLHIREGESDGGKRHYNEQDAHERVLGVSYRSRADTVVRLEQHWERVNKHQNQLRSNRDGLILEMATAF